MESYVNARLAERELIPEERRAALRGLAADLGGWLADGDLALLFICTHNSRRSHLAQVWAQLAAYRFGFDRVRALSGGTEVTALHPNAAAALARAGLALTPDPAAPGGADGANPVTLVLVHPERPPVRCFSKVWWDAVTPGERFVAVMTCSAADQACPAVAGALARVSLTYLDPKAFDDDPDPARGYDERCAQIAREMLYLFEVAAS